MVDAKDCRVNLNVDGSVDFYAKEKLYHFEAKEQYPNLNRDDLEFMSKLYIYGITELFDYNLAYRCFTNVVLETKITSFDMLVNHLYIYLQDVYNEGDRQAINDVIILRKVQKIVHLLKE